MCRTFKIIILITLGRLRTYPLLYQLNNNHVCDSKHFKHTMTCRGYLTSRTRSFNAVSGFLPVRPKICKKLDIFFICTPTVVFIVILVYITTVSVLLISPHAIFTLVF
jgi:hypothetical protein